MRNRLADATSSYLRQHAGNPVDWWEWSDAAFAQARDRDVPVLLSVGYASCHWCHVMAHESFEDAATAAEINARFVAIKVDREQRPDVDDFYMTATQALTGQGGWPMTCFLTPERRPFYAGTYFPPVPRSGMPSFRQVLHAVDHAWRERRDELERAAGEITRSLASTTPSGLVGELGPAELAAAADAILRQLDPDFGGFRGAPKFPPAAVCEFLLRHHERTGSAAASAAVELTLDRMARGGIFDQLAGGFARYSVDSRWRVPHFEKMLDDNAQLLRLYAHHTRLTGSTWSVRVADQIAEFLLRDLRTADGAFAASLDADVDGVEGVTYLWTRPQLQDALGAADGARAAAVFGLTDAPGGADTPDVHGVPGSVLTMPVDPDDLGWLDQTRSALLAARARRPQPERDEIVVLASNGRVITALAEAGSVLDRPDWVRAAAAAAGHLNAVHRTADGQWWRSSWAGRLGPGPAQLADLAELAAGLLALHQATGDADQLAQAVDLLDTAVATFVSADGQWRDSAAPLGDLAAQPADPTDGATPSGLSALAGALVTAAALTGRTELHDRAAAILRSIAGLVTQVPRSTGWHLAVAEAIAAGPLQVVISGAEGGARAELARVARRSSPGGSVVVVGVPDQAGAPLLAQRPELSGRPAAYVCRGFVCDRPVASPGELIALLHPPAP